MSLFDILACPACKSGVARAGESVRCDGCGRTFPMAHGVPIMLLDPSGASAPHEAELGERFGYSRWKERVVLKSLTDSHVALDFGAGRQALDDPCIIRMDIELTPFVDVVGDVHALPFRPGSLDFVFGGAVMEHLRDPHLAIRELYDALRPGGYVYADWSSVFAYHGYPHHYFNATLNGIRKAFAAFRILDSGVAPFHGGAFALRSVLGAYLESFRPRTLREHWFASRLDAILWAPLDDYDARFESADRFRVAAAVYVFGIKQPGGHERIIPEVIMDAWRRSAELQAAIPEPLDLSQPVNLMAWARSERAAAMPEVAVCLATRPRFSKYLDAGRAYDRSVVAGWPWELLDRVDPLPPKPLRLGRWFGRPVVVHLPPGWARTGMVGAVRRRLEAVLRWARRGRVSSSRRVRRGGA